MRLACLIFFACCHFVYGQNGVLTGINKGLLSKTVYSIYGDSEGQLWFCTDKGISLYNGKDFINYNVNNGMPENEVFGAFEDAQKRLWLKTLKGELFYIYRNKVVTKKSDPALQKLNSLMDYHSDDLIRHIFQINKDTVYFISNDKYVYTFSRSGASSRRVLPGKHNCYHHLYIAQKGLYGISKSGIFEFNSGKVVTPFEFDFQHFYRQFIKFKNATYFIKNNTIYRINGLEIEPYYTIPVKDQITYFNFVNNETLLLCSQKRSYLKKQDELVPFEQLNDVNVNYVFMDNEKNCWISSSNQGVFLLNNLSYHFYNNTALSSRYISEIINSPYGLIVGDYAGDVFLLNKKTAALSDLAINRKTDVPGSSTNLRSIALEDSTVLWIGYNNEIITYNLLTRKSKSIPKISIKNIQTDAYGKIWVTAMNGIASGRELENTGQAARYFKSPTFRKRRFYGFCHDSVLKQYYISRDNLFITYKDSITDTQALSSRILQIKTKNHQLFWIQNQTNHLLIYDRRSFETLPVFETTDAATSCNDLFLVNDSTAWVASNAGYCKVEISRKTKRIKKQSFYELMTATGPTAITKIGYDAGMLYLGTENGLISIREKDLKTEHYDVPILITRVTVNEQAEELKDQYKLRSDQTNLSLDYIGLYYQEFAKVNYRYKFAGTDTSWHYTKATHLEFPDLAPGAYTLTVNAMDHHGIPSRHRAVVTFFIATPWYETVLFMACLFILLSVVFFVGIRYYIKQKHRQNKLSLEIKRKLLQAREKQLEAEKKMFMAQVNPHFIFNSLNSIQKFILNSKPEEAYTYIEKFSKLIRNILINSKNDLVDIEEDIENLKTYLELEKLRFKDKLDVELIIPPGLIHEAKMPAMLVQPYVENAIWHGLMPKKKQGKLIITYRISECSVDVEIKDNGIGRVAAAKNAQHKKGTSSGMMLTEERIKLYAQKINREYAIAIHDLYEEGMATGTLVILKIPIN